LSFQCYKIAFLLPENEASIGILHILDIGLHPDFLKMTERSWLLLDEEAVRPLYKPRTPFSHTGTYGHAMIISGSFGKMGAAVLCAKACIHSGAGLLTVHIPRCGYNIMQTSVPEAMVQTDDDENILTNIKEQIEDYDVIGIGPGIGTNEKTTVVLRSVLSTFKKPMVIDADALNILGADQELIKNIPPSSILTPHPKEFERLFGKADNDLERISLASKKAAELNCVIVLKGRYSCIALPNGHLYFNSSGNPGMATGGSGDVLTGILAALVGQKYSPADAAKIGVYVHGRAGDLAAIENSQEYLTASELISHLGKAFLELYPGDEEAPTLT
jgi:NAD(P)H-hydrate epimerase